MRNNTHSPLRLIVIIAFSTQVITGCRSSNTCPTADDYLELNNLNRDELQLLITEYNEDIEADRENADLYVTRGIAYGQQGDYEAAISDYDQAIDLDPQHYVAHLNRGADYLDLGDIDQAIADFDVAISLLPACSPARRTRIRAC